MLAINVALILPLRSQIFEYMRETFCRRALGGTWKGRKKNVNKKIYIYSCENACDHYLAFVKTCGRWGHVFATSASPRSWTKKAGYVTLLHCSWRSVRYWICDIRAAKLLHAAFMADKIRGDNLEPGRRVLGLIVKSVSTILGIRVYL